MQIRVALNPAVTLRYLDGCGRRRGKGADLTVDERGSQDL